MSPGKNALFIYRYGRFREFPHHAPREITYVAGFFGERLHRDGRVTPAAEVWTDL